MPKKKRTRKQKIQTSQRHVDHDVMTTTEPLQANSQESTKQENAATGVSFSLPTSYHHKQASPISSTHTATAAAITTNDYGYLRKDLLKTGIVTAVIVTMECLMLFLYPMS